MVVYLILKMRRNKFCFGLDIFQEEFWRMTKVQTLLGTLVHVNSGFKMVPQGSPKTGMGGELKAKLKKKKSHNNRFSYRMASLT